MAPDQGTMEDANFNCVLDETKHLFGSSLKLFQDWQESVKIQFVHLIMKFFRDKLDDVSDAYGKRFYLGISQFKFRYNGMKV